MAAKKKRTPAQIAATKKLVALNKKKRGGKKKAGKKKASKPRKKAARKKAASKPRKKAARKAAPASKPRKKAARKKAASKPRKKVARRKKAASPRKASKKARTKTLTANDILGGRGGVSPKNLTATWICAGPKRTGCGGGKKGLQGSRVIGVLR